MSWIRSSKPLLVGLLIVAAVGVVGTAAGISFTDSDVPDELEIGEQAAVEISIENPYEDSSGNYTVTATTEFVNGNVEIRGERPAGETDEVQGDEPTLTVSPDDNYERIVIEATGEVPEISEVDNTESFNYSNVDQEKFTALNARADGESRTIGVQRFTSDSQDARAKIDEAIDVAGEDNSDVQRAITLYDSREFQAAIDDAEDAIDAAESSEQRSQLLLIGGGLLVLVVLAGGGYYVYSQRQQDTHKLQ